MHNSVTHAQVLKKDDPKVQIKAVDVIRNMAAAGADTKLVRAVVDELVSMVQVRGRGRESSCLWDGVCVIRPPVKLRNECLKRSSLTRHFLMHTYRMDPRSCNYVL